MPDILKAIAQICVDLDHVKSTRSVEASLMQATGVVGGEYMLFGIRTGRSIVPPRQLVITTFPRPWQIYYDAQNAHAFDPVLSKAFEIEGAFRWDGLHQDERQLALLLELERNGMRFGMSCGDCGADGSKALLSFCGDRPIGQTQKQWKQVAAAVVLLASVTNKAVTRILSEPSKSGAGNLSHSEAKTVQLVASGLTGKQVATELGVKPRTIRYYLDRAAEKLGVGSRKEVVRKAVVEGIVETRSFPVAGFRTSRQGEE